jgi:hypothetical protein
MFLNVRLFDLVIKEACSMQIQMQTVIDELVFEYPNGQATKLREHGAERSR